MCLSTDIIAVVVLYCTYLRYRTCSLPHQLIPTPSRRVLTSSSESLYRTLHSTLDTRSEPIARQADDEQLYLDQRRRKREEVHVGHQPYNKCTVLVPLSRSLAAPV